MERHLTNVRRHNGRRQRWLGTVSSILVVVFVSACSGSSNTPASDSTRSRHNVGTADTATTAQQYGYSPTRDSRITYQPDVVLIPNGASAIRSASANGLSWTMDRSIGDIDALKIGSVMFATSMAVGRVVTIQDAPGTRTVTLAPVALTDIIRDGSIQSQQAVDESAFGSQAIPEFPGGDPPNPNVTNPSAAPPSTSVSATTADMSGTPTIEFARTAINTSASTLPPPSKLRLNTGVGDWTLSPFAQNHRLGVSIDYKPNAHLKASAIFAFKVDHLKLVYGLDIHNATVSRDEFKLTGLTGFDIAIAAGVADGDIDNAKAQLETPIELEIAVPPSRATFGIPLTFSATFKVDVETALTGKNATLTAHGKYNLAGPIGFSGTSTLLPTFSVQQSLVDSIGGITLGPSGIVVGVGAKFTLGLGTPAAPVGFSTSLATTFGITNGSSLGAAFVRCHGATLDMNVKTGVGFFVSPKFFAGLQRLLPPNTPLNTSGEASTVLLHRSQTIPALPICAK